MESNPQDTTGMANRNADEYCEAHDREKIHTGGNIFLCPDCEREDIVTHPRSYEDVQREGVFRQNRDVLRKAKKGWSKEDLMEEHGEVVRDE